MVKTKLWAIALIFLITIIITAAQLCYKYGVSNFPEIKAITFIIIGMIFYILGAGLMIFAFRGGELSILYPLLALSYVWVSIASPIFFSADSMNPIKWSGVLIIILGISAIGVGSRR